MLRKIGLIASGSLLLLTSVATPAAGQATPIVRYLNAIPGTRIDICAVGRGEMISNLRYGRAAVLEMGAGTWTIQPRVAKQGSCKGARLASRQILLEPDDNDTLVFWRPKSTVSIEVFENDLSLPEAGAVTLVMRHMARAGAMDVWVWEHVKPAADDYFVPTFADLAKGLESSPAVVRDEGQVLIEAFPSAKSAPWDYEFLWQYLFANGAYQAYFIGTERSNYQIVLLGQLGTAPGP